MRQLLSRLVALTTFTASVLGAQNIANLGIGAVSPLPRSGQPAPKQRFFVSGDWYLSPRVFVGGVEGGATSFGLALEKGIGDPSSDADGLWAVGVDFDYYKYSVMNLVNVTVLPIGATLNYHFMLDNPRIDPYIGAGLGYFMVSASADGVAAVKASTIFFQSQLGVRYFLTDAAAIGAHVGSGIGNIAISGTIRF